MEIRLGTGNWSPAGPLRECPRSILVVMLSAVGDAVQVLPVVSALRRAFPSVHLTWVIQPGPYSLVADHPAVDEFVLFHRGKGGRNANSLSSGIGGIHSAAKTLRELASRKAGGRFDLLLDLQVYLKAGLLTALVPAQVKLGFDRRRARDFNWLFTTHRIPSPPQGFGHIQDQYFEFLQHIGVDPKPLEYGLDLSEEERTSQHGFFSSIGRPVCALVVGASDPRKNWTPEGYAEIATGLRSDFGLTPILVGSRSAAEEKMAQAILARGGEGVVDARGGGLRRLLWLLGGSALVISPDTGPLHMARAMDVTVVGLYGFTNPKRSGPYRRFTDLIVDGYARFPGEDYGVNMDRRSAGMGRVTPDMVMEKVALALRNKEG
ncbi:MAG: glycosyltransferase family 9 protein [Gemmatimonadota bacterium]